MLRTLALFEPPGSVVRADHLPADIVRRAKSATGRPAARHANCCEAAARSASCGAMWWSARWHRWPAASARRRACWACIAVPCTAMSDASGWRLLYWGRARPPGRALNRWCRGRRFARRPGTFVSSPGTPPSAAIACASCGECCQCGHCVPRCAKMKRDRFTTAQFLDAHLSADQSGCTATRACFHPLVPDLPGRLRAFLLSGHAAACREPYRSITGAGNGAGKTSKTFFSSG